MSSRVDDLLAELGAVMPQVSTPYTSADRADRVYEVYLFAQVIAAAADGGAVVEFEDHDERPVKDLVLRGAPGVLHRRGRFTHALLRIGTARPVEVHLRVKVQGKTIDSESDVLLIDTKNARDCRTKQQLPKAAGCVLSIEGKYHLTALPADEAFHYLGVRSGFPPSLTSLFASNSFSPQANQCLADIWTLTRSHDITAADLLTALAATSKHRDVTLRPLAEVIGDCGVVRAGAYTAYRRRLGPDAAKLPEGFAQVVDDVITFADPALASEVASRAIWTALSASWSG